MSKGSLGFNLLPPKTQEEIVVEKERDNTFFYSFILIFFGGLIFMFFTLGKTLVVDTRIASTQDTNQRLENQIESYNTLKQTNGELFVKSNALAPIIDNDIKLSQLLEIGDKLKEGVVGTEIESYSREFAGEFVISFTMASIEDIVEISKNADTIEFLANFSIRNVGRDSANGVSGATVSFEITNILQNEQ